jgi:hypothetical protein
MAGRIDIWGVGHEEDLESSSIRLMARPAADMWFPLGDILTFSEEGTSHDRPASLPRGLKQGLHCSGAASLVARALVDSASASAYTVLGSEALRDCVTVAWTSRVERDKHTWSGY